MAWKLIVNNAMKKAKAAAKTNTDQLILMRYAKFCSQLCIKYHATGDAISMAMPTSLKKSFDRSRTMPVTLAPKTFRIPISFVFLTTTKAIKPHKPMQQMKMEMAENALNKL